MKLSKKVQSLPALVLQGFVAGAILFFTLQRIARTEREPPTPAEAASVLATLRV